VAEDLVAELTEAGEPADKMAVDGKLQLAALYMSAARRAEAYRAYRDALPDVRRVYGPDHPKITEVERKLWDARRLRAYPVTRHPVLGSVFAVVALAGLLAFAFWPRNHALAPPPKPGSESPANAVAGFTAAFFTHRPAAACKYTVPSGRGPCTLATTVFASVVELSGSWKIGHTAISGSRAIVDVEYRVRDAFGESYVNTDPDAGLPHAGLSFDAAYQQVLSANYFAFATDCELVGGRWYVDIIQYGS
jgi:hypothetical protein